MKHRSEPNPQAPAEKSPPHLPVLTEVVHVVVHELDEVTIPGEIFQQPLPPQGGPLAPATSPIAAAMAKLSSPELDAPSMGLTPELQADHLKPDPTSTAIPFIDHYIPQTNSGFSSNWWLTSPQPKEPAKVAAPSVATAPVSAPSVAAAPAAKPLSKDEIVQRVLVSLNQQVANTFEQRIHEAVGPVLMRVTDNLLTELRQQLTQNIHDMVSHAVAVEMAKVNAKRNT